MKSQVSSQMLRRRNGEHGIALVIVLSMLVLLSALLVAFMSSATTELNATQAATAGSTARQIADSTVNLVIGQIREATTQPDESTTWASQPGAIRTYSGSLTSTKKDLNKEGSFMYRYNSGPNDFVYKLYSTDEMKVPTSAFPTSLAKETDVIENWDSDRPVDYVDLNEPLMDTRFDLDPDGKRVEPHYPIIDPRAMYSVKGSAQTNDKVPQVVEGFDAKLTKDEDGLKLAESGEQVPYLPMPVKWLYVLKDGTIGSAELGTKENPIVGRTAFWADDESCKLNINTASEGTFWDTPSVSTEQEAGNTNGGTTLTSSNSSLSLAVSSPTNGEYQRYPGHPATTCLSPVLGSFWGLYPSMSVYPRQNTDYQRFKETLYKISAFTPNGQYTTRGATINADAEITGVGRPLQSVDTKRIYATVDELMFKSARNTGGAEPTPELNNFNANFTPEGLEKTRFFLTATSRAPELNLFGRPRVTIWPIREDPALRTRFDDLFAFASTIAKTNDESNDKKYFLIRTDSKSAYADYNTQNKAMYEYLQKLTRKQIPGFGASLVGNISPAYSASTMDQILTETFDYVRTVNLVDTGTASNSANIFKPYTPRFYPEGTDQTYSRRNRAYDWSGQVTPLKINGTMGMGRFVTISEAALLFERVSATQMRGILLLEMATTMPGYPAIKDTYWTRITTAASGDDDPRGEVPNFPLIIDWVGNGKTPPPSTDAEFIKNTSGLVNIVSVGTHEVSFGRGFMPVLGFTNSMYYFPPHKKDQRGSVFGLTFPERYERLTDDREFNNTAGTNPLVKNFVWQDPANPGAPNRYDTARAATTNPGGAQGNYPYVTKNLNIPPVDPLGAAGYGTITGFKFRGPYLRVKIYPGQTAFDTRGSTGSANVVPAQTIDIKFDNSDVLPLPTLTGAQFATSTRFDGALDGNWDVLKSSGFVVRSMEFTGPTNDLNKQGDIRLGAALEYVPPTYFKARDKTFNTEPKYSGNAAMVHGLQSSHGDTFTGHTQGAPSGNSGTPGRLVTNSVVRNNKPMILPRGVNGVQRADNGPGDWDRGISKHMDGAFGNKVDEGNLKFDWGAGGYSRFPYYRGRGIEETGQSFFSPNRQMPSAVMFGSLPTGLDPRDPENARPWQTLLFRPDREGTRSHPGAAQPGIGKAADHLYLDLFHMPVVEPYAISEPFSTAGKVNLNYVIAPFGYAKGASGSVPGTQNSPRSYIRRDTALRGVMRSVWMMVVPFNAPEMAHPEGPLTSTNYRYPIDLDRTIEQMEARLNDQKQGVGARDTTLFRSASEICDIDLYPRTNTPGIFSGNVTLTNWNTFWSNQGGATGDNMRERPYAHIYPRVTTKSNVFTVHMRCQTIKKSPKSDPNEFDPEKDQVVGEYRGSATIERFIDPNDKALLNYNEQNQKVEPYYRFRIVNTKHFAVH